MRSEKKMINRLCRALIEERAKLLRLHNGSALVGNFTGAELAEAERDLLADKDSALRAAQDLMVALTAGHHGAVTDKGFRPIQPR